MATTENQVIWYKNQNQKVISNIEKAFVGKNHIVRLVIAGMISGGHILLEDVPGTGKTALARALGQSINGINRRIQFTPDLLPSDITGVNVYDRKSKEFVFHQGPIFAHIVLADEINRTSPKTQSALLEVMEEGHVTTDNITRAVGVPFLVIATQNPIEQTGTYRLPEAQLDRFLIKSSIGGLDHKSALDIISGNTVRTDLPAIIELDDIVKMKNISEEVYADPMVCDYIVQIVEATHMASQVQFGSSIRGALGLTRLAKAWAAAGGRNYITPDDVKELAIPVLAHRIILTPDAEFDGVKPEQIIQKILLEVPVPVFRNA